MAGWTAERWVPGMRLGQSIDLVQILCLLFPVFNLDNPGLVITYIVPNFEMELGCLKMQWPARTHAYFCSYDKAENACIKRGIPVFFKSFIRPAPQFPPQPNLSTIWYRSCSTSPIMTGRCLSGRYFPRVAAPSIQLYSKQRSWESSQGDIVREK